jgi:hypothetical protein
MSDSVRSLQTANIQTHIEQTIQPPKKLQTASQSSVPQDTVTISKANQQAHAGSTNAVAGRDKDRDRDSA